MSTKKPVYKPADYARGTVMEPEHISTLKSSFGEYEALGNRHRDLTERIDSLREKMKMSRQRGAFQALQEQMKEVKNLVKEREDVDARMSVADLARKKDDDHRIAVQQQVSYSEKLNSVGDRIAELESMMLTFSEGNLETLDFARCQRPDGSFYGTRGKCKKGTEAASGTEKTSKPPVKDVRRALKGLQAAAKQARVQARAAEKNAKLVEKETKGDKSPPARKRRLEANSAWDKANRAAERAERDFGRAYDALARRVRREQRQGMSPERRKAEMALDREMRLRG